MLNDLGATVNCSTTNMIEFARKLIEENFKKAVFYLALFFVLDILVFWQIADGASENRKLSVYFLPVGQGDSEFIELPGGVKILIDGGPPDALVLKNLDKILSPRDRYLDIVALSHVQLDHFGGLIEVLKRYDVGVFVWNGVPGETTAADYLMEVIKEKNISLISLAAGDVIRYDGSDVKVLWPLSADAIKTNLNETALVLELESNGKRALFTGDIGVKTENRIIADNLDKIDILKVGHHGSKFSSSANFLNALKPKAAIIEVGKNSYGHPTPEVLNRLADIGAQIFRTDRDGLIKFEPTGEALKIFKIE